LLDRIKIYELQIQSYQSQSMMTRAIDIGFEALEALGINLSLSISDRAMPELPRIEDLDNIPEMTDPQQLAALRILMALYPPIYIAKPQMIRPLILTMVNLAIEGGHSGLAAYGYVLYGMILCAVQGGIDQGYHAGKLALKLLEKFHATALKAKIYTLFNAHVRFWKEPAKVTLTAYLEGCQSGLETGDLEWASYNSMHYCKNLFLTGETLEIVEKKQATYLELLLKNKHEFALSYAKIWAQSTLNLQGKSSDKLQLIGERFDELHFLALWKSTNNSMSLFALYVAKANIFYLFKEYPTALDCTLLAGEHIQAAIGLITIGVYNFYHSLIMLAVYPQAEPSQQQQYILAIAENQANLREWSDCAPQNFLHKYWLIQAEQARVFGNVFEAMESYDQAIQGAKDTGYLQEEALANELAAEFYLGWGKEKVAAGYLQEAYYCYSHWGAKAKTDDLETRYPHLLVPILQPQRDRSLLSETPFQTHKSSLSDRTIQTSRSSSSSISESLDFASILKASQALSSQIQLKQLLSTLIQVVMENAGAKKAALLLLKDGNLTVEALANLNESVTLLSIPLATSECLPVTLIDYVKRTLKTVLLDDVAAGTDFMADSYFVQQQPKSVLCEPILHQGRLIGLLYLENQLTIGAFTGDRLEVVQLLCAQAAISLENARLYQQSQDYAQQLERSLVDLQQAQLQTIQSEKMATLGNLVAGVAHEINNPIGFLTASVNNAEEYIQDLLDHIQCYQKNYPDPAPEVIDHAEDIDLEFLIKDLPKLIPSMKIASQRIREISTTLRTFSRADTAEKVACNLHEGIDSTLLILKYRLKANDKRPGIEIVKDYGNLPLVKCFFGQINQVFMNIIANAIDALDTASVGRTYAELQAEPGRIMICTEMSIDLSTVKISIKDNGPGISDSVRLRVFDHLFTTKEVGKGTGLGLAIARQIVEETHGGKLSCDSAVGEGTEFAIEILID